MRSTMILTSLAIVLATGVCTSGEPTPEALLPVHENRDAYTPAAAFGKDIYLVVWQSGRFGEGDLRKGFEGLAVADIVGCRLDKDGKPVDAKPFVICGAKDLQQHPKVTFGNGVFLVVWHDLRNGKDWDVYAARVTPDGKVLDADGFVVAGGANNQACPRVAFDGKDFVVVWQDFRSDKKYEAFGARISAEGKVVDAQGVSLASGVVAGYHCVLPAVASSGGGKSQVLWLTKYSEGKPNAGTILFAEGRVTLGGAFPWSRQDNHGPGLNASPACLAAGPKNCLAAWRTEAPAGRSDAPNNSTAMVLDAEGKLVKRLHLAGGRRIQTVDATWDGANFVAAWHETQYVKWPKGGHPVEPYQAVFSARVSEAGELVGAAQKLSGSFEGPAAEPAVASDGAGTTLIAYEKHPDKAETPIKIGFRLLVAK